MSSKPNKFIVVSSILIILGLFFRLYNYGGYEFGFDQIQILEKSKLIRSGEPTLIGPRTGPAYIFTGPLIYYLNALSLLFANNHFSLVLTNALMMLATGVGLYVLSVRYLRNFSTLAQLTPLTIWAISPFLIRLDRIVWNPNLSLISTALIFFPLLKTRKLTKADYLYLCLGGLLSFQAHFTLLLIPFLALPIIFERRSNRVTSLVALIGGYILSFIPTLIFDMRHEWLNLKGLVSLATHTSSPILIPTANSYSESFVDAFRVLLETIGKVISHYRGSSASLWLGILLVLVSLVFVVLKISKSTLRSSLKWFLGSVLLFAFYTGSKPEYYFLIIVPACMVVCAYIINQTKLHPVSLFALSVIALTLVNLSCKLINQYPALSMGSVTEMVQLITVKNTNNSVSSVELKMPFGTHYGLEYLLKDIKLGPTGNKIIIYYPDPPAENYKEYNGLFVTEITQ